MKRLLRTVLLFFLVAAPVSAELQLEDLTIARTSGEVNIRATVHNPGPARVAGPIELTLEVRTLDSDSWEFLTSWDNVGGLPTGYRISRDYFGGSIAESHHALNGDFEIRASARSADGEWSELLRAYP